MWTKLPDAFIRAAGNQPGSVLLETARFDAENTHSYLFRDPSEILIVRELNQIPALFAAIERALQEGSWVAGFLGYECGYHFESSAACKAALSSSPDELPLAWFGVYRSPVCWNDRRENDGEDAGSGSGLSSYEWLTDEDNYRAQVEQIKRYIEDGDTYQVNLTTGLKMQFTGTPQQLLAAMMRSQPVAYGCLLNLGERQIVSASPELFFHIRNGRITTKPMKGTAQRGKDLMEDRQIADWLRNDAKNRSENLMIVDLLRSDLGRVCAMGSIRVDQLFAIEKYRTLFQMTSTVSGQLRPEATYYEIFKSLFPSGSVTGAPKVRTMQIIRELERRRRGVYTGAIGFISPQHEAVFNVAIRTITLKNGEAGLGVGSGIVYDSDARKEYEECHLKTAFLSDRTPQFRLIETMLWNGDYFLLKEHLDRLAGSAEYFDFEFDRETIARLLSQYAARLMPEVRYKTRLLLDRFGKITLTLQELDEGPEELVVTISQERVASDDRFLRHKTTHRARYDRLYAHARELGFHDLIFLNERGEVAETAVHNVFVARNGKWSTPPLSSGALPGVYRRHMLETHPDAVEQVLTLDDLLEADSVYLCNAVRGLQKIRQIVR